MLALLDLDAFAFRCAASAENEEEEIALARLDELVRTTLHEVECEEYKGWLTGSNNYRYSIYPEYKANRKDKPRPTHLQACRTYLVEEWNAIVVEGKEADDALAIDQHCSDTLMVGLDKDLLQVPGRHYNFVKKIFLDVTETEGLRSFYKQLLTGDSSDNVKGVDKIGPVKAGKLLDPVNDEQQMFDIVRRLYNNDERLLMNGKLLWLQRVEGDVWNNSEILFHGRD